MLAMDGKTQIEAMKEIVKSTYREMHEGEQYSGICAMRDGRMAVLTTKGGIRIFANHTLVDRYYYVKASNDEDTQIFKHIQHFFHAKDNVFILRTKGGMTYKLTLTEIKTCFDAPISILPNILYFQTHNDMFFYDIKWLLESNPVNSDPSTIVYVQSDWNMNLYIAFTSIVDRKLVIISTYQSEYEEFKKGNYGCTVNFNDDKKAVSLMHLNKNMITQSKFFVTTKKECIFVSKFCMTALGCKGLRVSRWNDSFSVLEKKEKLNSSGMAGAIGMNGTMYCIVPDLENKLYMIDNDIAPNEEILMYAMCKRFQLDISIYNHYDFVHEITKKVETLLISKVLRFIYPELHLYEELSPGERILFQKDYINIFKSWQKVPFDKQLKVVDIMLGSHGIRYIGDAKRIIAKAQHPKPHMFSLAVI